MENIPSQPKLADSAKRSELPTPEMLHTPRSVWAFGAFALVIGLASTLMPQQFAIVSIAACYFCFVAMLYLCRVEFAAVFRAIMRNKPWSVLPNDFWWVLTLATIVFIVATYLAVNFSIVAAGEPKENAPPIMTVGGARTQNFGGAVHESGTHYGPDCTNGANCTTYVSPPIIAHKNQKHSVITNPSVRLECLAGFASVAVPPSQRIYVLPLDVINFKHLAPNAEMPLIQFFTKAPIGSEWDFMGAGLNQATQCTFTNYGGEPLFLVEMGIQFQAAIKAKQPEISVRSGAPILTTIARLQIPVIESGAENPFIFYIFEMENDEFSAVTLPKKITASSLTNKNRRSFDLIDVGQISPLYFVPQSTAPPPEKVHQPQ